MSDPFLKKIVANKYRVLSPIAQGGMSAIYLADHVGTGELVALKIMKRELVENHQAKNRFLREVNNLKRLHHRNILQVKDSGEVDANTFMVLEYMDKGTVDSLIQKLGRLPWPLACFIMAEVCSGLYYSHRQDVIHRDMKPENLMITSQGDVKIADFGISKTFEATTMTQIGEIIGTPSYMPPEQIMGERVDFTADIFACGVILYELLTGTNPFQEQAISQTAMKILHYEPPSLHQIDSMIPEGLDNLVRRMLEKKPEKRPGTVLEVKRELQNFLSLSPTPMTSDQFRQFLKGEGAYKHLLDAQLASARYRQLQAPQEFEKPATKAQAYDYACQLLDALSYGPSVREVSQLLEAFLRKWNVVLPSQNPPNLKELCDRYNENPSNTVLLRIIHLQEMTGNSVDVVFYLGILKQFRPGDQFIQEKIDHQIVQLRKLIAKWLDCDTADTQKTRVLTLDETGELLADAVEAKLTNPPRLESPRRKWLVAALIGLVFMEAVYIAAFQWSAGVMVMGDLAWYFQRSSVFFPEADEGQKISSKEAHPERSMLHDLEARLERKLQRDELERNFLEVLLESAKTKDSEVFQRRLVQFLLLFPEHKTLRETYSLVQKLKPQEQMEAMVPILNQLQIEGRTTPSS